MTTRDRLSAALIALAACVVPPAHAQTPDDSLHVGDRVLLRVEGEQQWSDTFTVTPGPALVLPAVGELPLRGARRGNIEPYLARALGEYLKDPVVHARVLVRLAVLGDVEHPGFYAVPADAVVTQALMVAGGPTREAGMSSMRIERGDQQLWGGRKLEQAITSGMTVAQMQLRSGDRIVIPKHHDTRALFLAVLLAIPGLVYAARAF
jgi:protein involved in polysaccharide export with SLBB domain